MELVTPSYFQMTFPRKEETAKRDNLHYIKSGIAADYLKESPDGSGDRLYCNGPVGIAWSRILMDHICDPTAACAPCS